MKKQFSLLFLSVVFYFSKCTSTTENPILRKYKAIFATEETEIKDAISRTLQITNRSSNQDMDRFNPMDFVDDTHEEQNSPPEKLKTMVCKILKEHGLSYVNIRVDTTMPCEGSALFRTIYLNPHYCKKLSNEAIRGIIRHECLHIIFQDPTQNYLMEKKLCVNPSEENERRRLFYTWCRFTERRASALAAAQSKQAAKEVVQAYKELNALYAKHKGKQPTHPKLSEQLAYCKVIFEEFNTIN